MSGFTYSSMVKQMMRLLSPSSFCFSSLSRPWNGMELFSLQVKASPASRGVSSGRRSACQCLYPDKERERKSWDIKYEKQHKMGIWAKKVNQSNQYLCYQQWKKCNVRGGSCGNTPQGYFTGWICYGYDYIIHDVLLEVTFLYAEWVDGPVAGVGDAVLCTSSHDSMVDWKARVFGNVQLPAELSDKWQTHSSHLDKRGEERRLREMKRGM